MENQIIKSDGHDYSVKYKQSQIEFDEYEALKKRVDQIRDEYMKWEVTPDLIQESKNARALLHKKRKETNDLKNKIVKMVDEPVTNFKGQIKTLLDELDEAADHIDKQVKVIEQNERDYKHNRNMQFISESAEKAGVDPSKIEYDKRWDNKSFTYPQFQKAVSEQITHLLADKKFYEDNLIVLAEKATQAKLNADTYKQLFDSGSPLSKVLNQIEIDQKVIADNYQPTKPKPKHFRYVDGKAYDAKTGEFKGDAYEVDLTLTATKEQLTILNEFIKESGISAKRIFSEGA